MTRIAVIAHAGKSFGGGLPELRRELARQGVVDPLWIEVPKSRYVPKQVTRALAEGAELLFAWGGDGTVQRCIDALAGSDTALAILPAGTANLLATNLDIPQDIEQAVAIGLRGGRHQIDVGCFDGERFAVMAGVGFDASMIQQADGTLKDRLGRVAYIWTGSQNLRAKPFRAKIKVDGAPWYAGDASCILVGNVGRLFGGIEVFEDARPDDGRFEIGIVNAEGIADWVRTLARTAVGQAERSPLVQATTATKIKVKLSRKMLYELDGGDRSKVKSFKVSVQPGAVTLCLPEKEPSDNGKHAE
jgi:diacylglycerol kinase (ATP)